MRDTERGRAGVGWRAAVALGLVAMLAAGCGDGSDAADRADGGDRAPGRSTTTTATSSGAPSTTQGAVDEEPAVSPASSRPESSTSAPAGDAPRESPSDRFHPSGVALRVPDGWEERGGAALATEFAAEADCRTALVVDFEPPPHPDQSGGAGEGSGQTLQTVVQVCARPTGGQTLDDFMRETYGDAGGFEATEVDGRRAHRGDTGSHTLIFTQTTPCRFQIAIAVDADPALEAQRQREAQQTLESVRLDEPTGACA